jgi:hypothetical protein
MESGDAEFLLTLLQIASFFAAPGRRSLSQIFEFHDRIQTGTYHGVMSCSPQKIVKFGAKMGLFF